MSMEIKTNNVKGQSREEGNNSGATGGSLNIARHNNSTLAAVFEVLWKNRRASLARCVSAHALENDLTHPPSHSFSFSLLATNSLSVLFHEPRFQ